MLQIQPPYTISGMYDSKSSSTYKLGKMLLLLLWSGLRCVQGLTDSALLKVGYC